MRNRVCMCRSSKTKVCLQLERKPKPEVIHHCNTPVACCMCFWRLADPSLARKESSGVMMDDEDVEYDDDYAQKLLKGVAFVGEMVQLGKENIYRTHFILKTAIALEFMSLGLYIVGFFSPYWVVGTKHAHEHGDDEGYTKMLKEESWHGTDLHKDAREDEDDQFHNNVTHFGVWQECVQVGGQSTCHIFSHNIDSVILMFGCVGLFILTCTSVWLLLACVRTPRKLRYLVSVVTALIGGVFGFTSVFIFIAVQGSKPYSWAFGVFLISCVLELSSAAVIMCGVARASEAGEFEEDSDEEGPSVLGAIVVSGMTTRLKRPVPNVNEGSANAFETATPNENHQTQNGEQAAEQTREAEGGDTRRIDFITFGISSADTPFHKAASNQKERGKVIAKRKFRKRRTRRDADDTAGLSSSCGEDMAPTRTNRRRQRKTYGIRQLAKNVAENQQLCPSLCPDIVQEHRRCNNTQEETVTVCRTGADEIASARKTGADVSQSKSEVLSPSRFPLLPPLPPSPPPPPLPPRISKSLLISPTSSQEFSDGPRSKGASAAALALAKRSTYPACTNRHSSFLGQADDEVDANSSALPLIPLRTGSIKYKTGASNRASYPQSNSQKGAGFSRDVEAVSKDRPILNQSCRENTNKSAKPREFSNTVSCANSDPSVVDNRDSRVPGSETFCSNQSFTRASSAECKSKDIANIPATPTSSSKPFFSKSVLVTASGDVSRGEGRSQCQGAPPLPDRATKPGTAKKRTPTPERFSYPPGKDKPDSLPSTETRPNSKTTSVGNASFTCSSSGYIDTSGSNRWRPRASTVGYFGAAYSRHRRGCRAYLGASSSSATTAADNPSQQQRWSSEDSALAGATQAFDKTEPKLNTPQILKTSLLGVTASLSETKSTDFQSQLHENRKQTPTIDSVQSQPPYSTSENNTGVYRQATFDFTEELEVGDTDRDAEADAETDDPHSKWSLFSLRRKSLRKKRSVSSSSKRQRAVKDPNTPRRGSGRFPLSFDAFSKLDLPESSEEHPQSSLPESSQTTPRRYVKNGGEYVALTCPPRFQTQRETRTLNGGTPVGRNSRRCSSIAERHNESQVLAEVHWSPADSGGSEQANNRNSIYTLPSINHDLSGTVVENLDPSDTIEEEQRGVIIRKVNTSKTGNTTLSNPIPAKLKMVQSNYSGSSSACRVDSGLKTEIVIWEKRDEGNDPGYLFQTIYKEDKVEVCRLKKGEQSANPRTKQSTHPGKQSTHPEGKQSTNSGTHPTHPGKQPPDPAQGQSADAGSQAIDSRSRHPTGRQSFSRGNKSHDEEDSNKNDEDGYVDYNPDTHFHSRTSFNSFKPF